MKKQWGWIHSSIGSPVWQRLIDAACFARHEASTQCESQSAGQVTVRQSPQHTCTLSIKTSLLACSPFCWASRFALIHKGLKYETVPWHFHEEEKIKMSNQGLVCDERCFWLCDLSKRVTSVPGSMS